MINYCAKWIAWINQHRCATIRCTIVRSAGDDTTWVNAQRSSEKLQLLGVEEAFSLPPRLRPFANNLIWSYFTSKLVTFASHFHFERNGERSLAILDCCCLFLKVNRAIWKEYFLLQFRQCSLPVNWDFFRKCITCEIRRQGKWQVAHVDSNWLSSEWPLVVLQSYSGLLAHQLRQALRDRWSYLD